ncbi:MAG TPA: DUF6036 family nucleotidyltransferase [Longimicrobium sp.]
MVKAEMLDALRELGSLCPAETEVVVIGGGAAILRGWLARATVDIDVAAAQPALASFRRGIAEVAEALGLPEGWMNDGAKAFARVLPPDFTERLEHVCTFGGLTVKTISRRDFVLMKLFAMRAEDVEDLRTLAPTREELEFVRNELPRLAAFEPKRAHLIELYVEQGGGL